MSFTEREAIKFEMEELKEQARRDFEIYLTSRNVRNERYTQLMNRLREIDERSLRNKSNIQVKSVQGNPETVKERMKFWEEKKKESLPIPKFQGTPSELKLDKIRPNQEIIIKEEPVKQRKKQAKIEDIDPLVEKYLRFRQTEERTKDIQAYVENETGNKWVNFSVIMLRILELNPRIKKADRKGYYYYDSI